MVNIDATRPPVRNGKERPVINRIAVGIVDHTVHLSAILYFNSIKPWNSCADAARFGDVGFPARVKIHEVMACHPRQVSSGDVSFAVSSSSAARKRPSITVSTKFP